MEILSVTDSCFLNSLIVFFGGFCDEKGRKPLKMILYKLVYFYPIIDVNIHVKILMIIIYTF